MSRPLALSRLSTLFHTASSGILFAHIYQQTLATQRGLPRLRADTRSGDPMAPQPDYSRAALARFIEFVVAKGLVHPATAQGWRVATAKVLEELSPSEEADVRTIDVESTFKAFLNRYPGRLSPASVGEYRRRVHRAIEEFVRWMADPGGYAFRAPARPAKAELRRRLDAGAPPSLPSRPRAP